MRQLTKEVYEAPLTTKRVVMMESSACVAASVPTKVKVAEEVKVEDYESFTNEITFE